MKTITLTIAALVALFFVACGGGGGGSTPAPACTVEINADSICSATGIPATCAQVLAEIRPGWVVDDRAIAGLTLNRLSDGFVSDAHPSHVVVIALGGNDAYEVRAPDVFAAQLAAIVGAIQGQGKAAVLTGIPPFKAGSPDYFPDDPFDQAVVDRAAAMNAAAHKVAQATGAIDARWDLVPFDPATDTIDGIHRTAAAHRLLVTRLAEAIDAACK